MEKFGDGYGYAVYETSIWGGGSQVKLDRYSCISQLVRFGKFW